MGKGKKKRQRKGNKSRFTYRNQQAAPAPAQRALAPDVRVTLARINLIATCVRYGGIAGWLAILYAIVRYVIDAPEGKGTLALKFIDSLANLVKNFNINSILGVILSILCFLIIPFLIYIGYKLLGLRIDNDDTDIEV